MMMVYPCTFSFCSNALHDPHAPGGKEHIGYIVDRTGFEEFKRRVLKAVTLPQKVEVSQTMCRKGIKE